MYGDILSGGVLLCMVLLTIGFLVLVKRVEKLEDINRIRKAKTKGDK